MLPILSRLLPHMQARLEAGWNAILSTSSEQARLAALQGLNTSEDAKTANDEVIHEQLLRELTNEHMVLLRCLLGQQEG